MSDKLKQVMAELKDAGKENTAKIWRNHGAKEDEIFGVPYGEQKAFTKKYKKDHELALALWDTGNHDAKILATMIADPKQATREQLQKWVEDCGDYMDTDALSSYASKTALAREMAEAWHDSDDEWISTAGWNLVGALATDKTLEDAYFQPYLDIIERDIHNRQNRVRYAMNMALIGIGARSAENLPVALHVANAIGEVYVDHGLTNCETPEAASYMVKTREYLERKEKKVTT